eukprot:GILK01005694.1.p1 GENE.GILK01005694.1~~GILK01005694.1.p1  ORF type:complete len:457 (-),score=58.63 GILK01005694.1:201-1571(-)
MAGGKENNSGNKTKSKKGQTENGKAGKSGAVVKAEPKAGTEQKAGALAPKTVIMAKWKDGEFHAAVVLESRRRLGAVSSGEDGPHNYDYYVHYHEFNRRLDEWKSWEHVKLDVDPSVVGEHQEATHTHKKSRKKRKTEESAPGAYEHDEHEGIDAASLAAHEEATKVKNINFIELGRHRIDTWYFSPFPEEYHNIDTLYVCEFCLNFFKYRPELDRHQLKCDLRHPPGNEIYRDGDISMFEVDGHKQKIYCENICYLAKLFLDHKTLYYDVDPFLFYIVTEVDDKGCHFVGYFSKEKNSAEGYNLACILTLPAYQRKGYGKFLIAFSYELSLKEGKVGSPERPLSDLGYVSYKSWWTQRLLAIIRDHPGTILSIQELSDLTAIKTEDIIHTLENLGVIRYYQGQHIISASPAAIEYHLKHAGRPGIPVNPEKLHWTPLKIRRRHAPTRGEAYWETL